MPSAQLHLEMMGIGPDATARVQLVGTSAVDLCVPIPAESSDVDVDVYLDRAKAVALWIASDYELVIRPNSKGANALRVSPNAPCVWTRFELLERFPFKADVTRLFVDNPGSTPATLCIKMLSDATPPVVKVATTKVKE